MKFLKTKKMKAIAAIALGACVVAGTVLGVGYGTGLFNGSDSVDDVDFNATEVVAGTDASTDTETKSNLSFNVVESNGITLTSSAVLTSGTVSNETTSKVITATISPFYPSSSFVNWFVYFVDSSSEWASGKSAKDYVSCVISSDFLSCTLTCLAPFAEQMYLIVYVNEYPSVYATATIDYVNRPTDASFSMSLQDYDDNSDAENWSNQIFKYSSESDVNTINAYAYSGVYYDSSKQDYTLYETLAANVSTTDSVGTVDDTWTISKYRICQNRDYDCWSDFDNNYYEFSSAKDFNYEDMFNALFYSDDYVFFDGDSTAVAYFYYLFGSYSSDSIATLEVTFEGANSGLTYTAEFGICFDFSTYIYIDSIELDNTHIYF